MKKIIIFILSLALLFSCGCTKNTTEKDVSDTIIQLPVIPEDAFDDTEEEQKKNKKLYLCSTVNGLRIRSKANLSSSSLGTLDKNDLVSFIGEDGDFYITEYKQQTAYVYSDYCTILEFNTAEQNVEKAIDLGSSLLGYPYVWGSQRYHWGNGKLNGNFVDGEFDCSALVQYIYYISNGVILDVTSRLQSLNGQAVDNADLQRGDLMFFTNASRKNKSGLEKIGHVGVYFGDNYILHTASDHAVIEPISSTRWSYFICARRVV